MALQTVIVLVIILAVFILLVLIFLTPKGLIQKAAEKSGVILTYLPGREEPTPAEEVTVPKEVEDTFDQWVKMFKDYKDSPGECFIAYPKPSDFKDNQIQFSHLDDKLIIKLIASDGRTKKFEEIEGLKTCVVAGKSTGGVPITYNFYKAYLFGTVILGIFNPHFSDVTYLYVTWGKEDSGELSIETNLYPGKYFEYDYGKMREGYWFKPDKEHICFFQLEDLGWEGGECRQGDGNDPNRYYEKYLDDDCLNYPAEKNCESVPCRLNLPAGNNKKLSYCQTS